ncbi:MAG: redoxin domain-containing protein [Candidatus Rokubacteria bacterium]|nr:redoxin domain-containing protein [Candidatus Rokubacteria bacterium]
MKLQERGSALLAISGDSQFCQAEFARARNFPFPLLSDVHRVVIRSYGVLDEARNVAYRSTFIVDREGMLRWGQAGDRHMIRDGAEILRVLNLVDKLRQQGKSERRSS